MQNMSALIHHSVQQECAFVPRAATASKPAPQKASSFVTETVNTADSKAISVGLGKDAVVISGVPATSKKRSNQESSMAKPCDPTSELVTSICEIRYLPKFN